MIDVVPKSWRPALETAIFTRGARQLGGWLRLEEESGKAVLPPRGQRLKALEITPLETVRVVILGQDPYHGPGQAHGLSFSVPSGVQLPPSLRNIYREVRSDLGVNTPNNGDLTRWAEQGVLLLNATLTVEAGIAASHTGRGWEFITNACLKAVLEQNKPTVFMLWGSHAQKKVAQVPEFSLSDHNLILRSAHPSPLSAYRGFFGSRPFSQANTFLEKHGRGTIKW